MFKWRDPGYWGGIVPETINDDSGRVNHFKYFNTGLFDGYDVEHIYRKNQGVLRKIRRYYSTQTDNLPHQLNYDDSSRYLAILPFAICFPPVFYPIRSLKDKYTDDTPLAQLSGLHDRYIAIQNIQPPPVTPKFQKAADFFINFVARQIGPVNPVTYEETLVNLRPAQLIKHLKAELFTKTRPMVKTEQNSGTARLFWTCPQFALCVLRMYLNALDMKIKEQRKHANYNSWLGGFLQANFCGLNNLEQADQMKMFHDFVKLNGLTAGEWDFSRCDARIPCFAYDLLETLLLILFPQDEQVIIELFKTIRFISVKVTLDGNDYYLNTMFCNISGARTTTMLNTIFNLFDQFWSGVQSGLSYTEALKRLGPSGGDDACITYNTMIERTTRLWGSKGKYVPIWSPTLGYDGAITMLGRWYPCLDLTPINVARYTNLGKFNTIYAGSCTTPVLALKRRLQGYQVTDSTSPIWSELISALYKVYDLDNIGEPTKDKELEFKKNLAQSHYPFDDSIMCDTRVIRNYESYFGRPISEIQDLRSILSAVACRADLLKLEPFKTDSPSGLVYGSCSFFRVPGP